MKFHTKVSPLAEQFITAGRGVLYSAKTIPVIKNLVMQGKTLELGAAPLIATTFVHLQAKLGPVKDDKDKLIIVAHLSQDVADMAHELHDPAAKDKEKAGHRIFLTTARILAGQHPDPTKQQPPQQPLAQMQPQGMVQ